MHLNLNQSYNLIKTHYNRLRDYRTNNHVVTRQSISQLLPVCLLESMYYSKDKTVESFYWHFTFYDFTYNRRKWKEGTYGEYGEFELFV